MSKRYTKADIDKFVSFLVVHLDAMPDMIKYHKT